MRTFQQLYGLIGLSLLAGVLYGAWTWLGMAGLLVAGIVLAFGPPLALDVRDWRKARKGGRS